MAKIYTHSGGFHQDEVFASAFLNKLFHLRGDIDEDNLHTPTNIIRTREPAVLARATKDDYTVDVGGVYNSAQKKFDHHQVEFKDYYDDRSRELGIKMSSFGLVYKEYAEEFMRLYCAKIGVFANASASKISIDIVKAKNIDLEKWKNEFYHKFVLEIDANDNGVYHLRDSANAIKLFEQNFTAVNITRMLNEPQFRYEEAENWQKGQNKRFLKAYGLSLSFLEIAFESFLNDKKDQLDALDYLRRRHELGANTAGVKNDEHKGHILVLDRPIEWYKVLKPFEQATGLHILYAIVPDANPGWWKVQTVELYERRFYQRSGLIGQMESGEWSWLDPEKDHKIIQPLSKELAGMIHFVHNERFIAVLKSLESAIEYVELCVWQYKKYQYVKTNAKANAMNNYFI